ncbi:MAG: hypothetical protein PVJ68_07730 [Candidatus Thiodiazotropha sp.]|jgi:hypothetical protein
MSKRLFISYSKDNYEVANRLMLHLENQNAVHNNFLDIFLDTKRLKAGYQWDPVIQQNLQCADGYLFLASIDSLSSPYIKTNELPAMAFEHLTNGCPIYLFLVSECSLGVSVAVDGRESSLTLNSLEVAGPKQANGRHVWFDQVPQKNKESTLSRSARVICEGMLSVNDRKTIDCASRYQFQQPVRPVKPGNLAEKPRVNRYIAHLNRYQIADSLQVELAEHRLVAVAARVIDSDWIEGVALRFGYDKLATDEGEDNRPHQFDIEWPLLSLDNDVREKTLWSPLFEGFSIKPGADLETSISKLYVTMRERLHKQVRIVVHYKLRDSKSKAKKDKQLLQTLGNRWRVFMETLDGPLKGKIILLFSLNKDMTPAAGWRAWLQDGPLKFPELSGALQRELTHGNCCVIDGGVLAKIVSGDTDRWKHSVSQARISEAQADAIILAVEESIPEGGIRHRNLMKTIKQHTAVRSLFKVT